MIPRDELDSREIEGVADAWGRIAVVYCFATPTTSPQERAHGASAVDFHVSISRHAIAIAIAIAVLVR